MAHDLSTAVRCTIVLASDINALGSIDAIRGKEENCQDMWSWLGQAKVVLQIRLPSTRDTQLGSSLKYTVRTYLAKLASFLDLSSFKMSGLSDQS